MSLEHFRSILKEYLHRGGYSQKQLAFELGLHPTMLSNKLNEHNFGHLTYFEIKQIVRILADWNVISTRQEALALLAEVNLSPSSFSQAEWANPPLNLLLETAHQTGYSTTGVPSLSRTKASLARPKPLQPSALSKPSELKTVKDTEPAEQAITNAILHTKTADWQEWLNDTPMLPSELFGRETELAWLQEQVFERKTRLLGLIGLGGVGKTALAFNFVQMVKSRFDHVVWYSLHNAPSPQTTLAYLLNKLVAPGQLNQLSPSPTEELHPQLVRLLERLQQNRCLLVLDNFETVLESGKPTGSYLSGYEGYGLLLELAGRQPHQSCLLITTREKPKELALLEKAYAPVVVSLPLGGLNVEAGRKLLNGTNGVSTVKGSNNQWEQLINYYYGNALALKLLKEPLQMLFGGSIEAFLAEKWGVFGDIRDLLAQHFARLSELEQQILYWIALERQALSLEELKANFRQPVSTKILAEAVVSLGRRSLVELEGHYKAGYFGLQPVVLEYLTERLVAVVAEELIAGEVSRFLGNYALLKAETRDYIRQSQLNLMVLPVLHRLELELKSREKVSQRIWQLLEQAKTRPLEEQGYEGGNLINLLVGLKVNLRGADFSGLRIWQAYLQGIPMEGVNLAWSELRGCLFSNAFSGVECVAFSPDGKLVASSGMDGKVWLWEVATGQSLDVLEGHSGRVWSVNFSPDGKLIASGSADTTIRVWDLSSGRCRQTYVGHTSEVKAVAFSPDGKLLASGSGGHSVRLWEVDRGQCRAVLAGHTDEIWSVVFSPNGQTLASGSADATIRLWDTVSGECFKLISSDINWIWSVAFSPDGQTLASGSSDHTVRLWEVASGECRRILRGHTNRIYSVAFSPDGKFLASGSSDQTIRLWEVVSGECQRILQGHNNLIKSISFSPDGKLLASGSPDQSIRLWETTSGQCLRIYDGYSSRINSAAFSPDEHFLASGSDDSTIRLWDEASAKVYQTLRHPGFVKSIAFSPNGKLLASGGADSLIRVWELASGKCLKTLQGYPSWVWSLAFSRDSQLLANSGNADNIYVWDVWSGRLLKLLEGHTNFVRMIAFSRDGKLLASASNDYTVRLWDIISGGCLKTFEGHTDTAYAVDFSPDGQVLASSGADHTIHLWEVATGQCLKVLKGHSNLVGVVEFTPDGQYLVSSGFDRKVKVWDTKNWQPVFDLEDHHDIVRTLAFHPAGQKVAGGDENYLRVWDLQSRQVVQVMKNPGLYEGLNIYGVTGLSAVQEANLQALGAIRTNP